MSVHPPPIPHRTPPVRPVQVATLGGRTITQADRTAGSSNIVGLEADFGPGSSRCGPVHPTPLVDDRGVRIRAQRRIVANLDRTDPAQPDLVRVSG